MHLLSAKKIHRNDNGIVKQIAIARLELIILVER